VIGTEGKWSRVRTKEGATGWIFSDYLARHAYVSVGASVAPMRQGPNSEDPILWKVNKNWPLQIVERTEHWAKVRDCDGSEGWIHESNLSADNYVVVKAVSMNLREGPGVDKDGNPKAPRRFAAQKGVIFLVLDAKDGWLKLRHKDGDEGWAGAKQVWGWE
jgi:SH3-like domain-containing protein